MDDTLIIRQQIEETKLQLTDKLECLEQQVSQTVQSAGDAVAATVEAVQETVESVTGAVEGAVHSVSHAFDLQEQIDKHPFVVLGGAVALGYIAAECMSSYEVAQKNSLGIPSPLNTAPLYPPNPLWNELKSVALGVLAGTIQSAVMRAVPEIVSILMNNTSASPGYHSDATGSSADVSPQAIS